MNQLPMTPYEKSLRARKIALYAGGAAMASFIIYGIVTAEFDEKSMPEAGDLAASETKAALDPPSRDDAIVVGSIPPKIEQGGMIPASSLQVKRVQLPSPEAIRASLGADKKVAGRQDNLERGFETCLPKCETRDPLVAGARTSQRPAIHQPAEGEAHAVAQPTPLPPDRSLLQRGGDFLGLVADAPGLTIDKGRQAIRYAGDLFQ